MISSPNFIKATEKYNTFEESIPAYYFRKVFSSPQEGNATITVAVCGFYELYFNGARITKGFLSPYLSNTNDYIYYDEYTVTLDAGENAIGILLGNGFQNNPGGYIWDFDKADFRSAPMFGAAAPSASLVDRASTTGRSLRMCDLTAMGTVPSTMPQLSFARVLLPAGATIKRSNILFGPRGSASTIVVIAF